MRMSQLVSSVDEVARQMHPGRTVLTAVVAVFFAIGWAVGKVVHGVWLVLSWALAAVRIGFVKARTPAGKS